MASVSAKTPLLMDGWYTISQLARIVETGEHGALSTSDEPETAREHRMALARSLRSFLSRSIDLAESFGVWGLSRGANVASPHRVHVEGDMATGVEFAEEV